MMQILCLHVVSHVYNNDCLSFGDLILLVSIIRLWQHTCCINAEFTECSTPRPPHSLAAWLSLNTNWKQLSNLKKRTHLITVLYQHSSFHLLVGCLNQNQLGEERNTSEAKDDIFKRERESGETWSHTLVNHTTHMGAFRHYEKAWWTNRHTDNSAVFWGWHANAKFVARGNRSYVCILVALKGDVL